MNCILTVYIILKYNELGKFVTFTSALPIISDKEIILSLIFTSTVTENLHADAFVN